MSKFLRLGTLRKQQIGYSTILMLLFHLIWTPRHQASHLPQMILGYLMEEGVSLLTLSLIMLFLIVCLLYPFFCGLFYFPQFLYIAAVHFKKMVGCAGYRLFGIVSHIGTSTQCGHYVAHVFKNGRWVIFNDNKVGASVNPPKDMGYLYFFERLDSQILQTFSFRRQENV